MIIKDINISEIDRKSLNNLSLIISSMLKSERIPKALLNQKYPLPNICKSIAWIIAATIILIGSILITVYGINFDLIQDIQYNITQISSISNNNYNLYSNINCNDNIIILVLNDYNMKETDVFYEHKVWRQNISNTPSFLGWSLYQSLFISFLFVIIPNILIETICKSSYCKCCKRIN